MNKILLTILSLLLFNVSFALESARPEDPSLAQVQTDSSKINFHEMQKLKLYPNPASVTLNVDYEIVFVKEAKFQIYNSIGAVVYTKTLTETQDKLKIPVSEFDNGLYFCSLKIDGNLLNTKKILINH